MISSDLGLVMVESSVVVTADGVSFCVFGGDGFLIKLNKNFKNDYFNK